MTSEFEKAMDEASTKYSEEEYKGEHWYKKGATDEDFDAGANWAYEYMCNENFQFALHRSWVAKSEKQQAIIDRLKEALIWYSDSSTNGYTARKTLIEIGELGE